MALCGLVLLTMRSLATGILGAPVDPRGPVEYPGMAPLVNEQGVQVKGYTFVNECRKPSPWQAKWIWLESSPSVAMFRKEVTLAGAPSRVIAWMTADMKYRLYVNGRLVSRGPVDMGRDYAGGDTHHWFYDCRDLTPFFQAGSNVIAAEVFRQWPIGFTVSRGSPGFLFEAEVTLPGQEKLAVNSDTTWRALPAAQFPDSATYDSRKEPAGWRSPGFDDSAWPTCRGVKDIWKPLVPSEIPPLMEARYPVQRIERLPGKIMTQDGSCRVVFDRVLSAYPTLKVKGGKGARVTLRAQQAASVILDGGERYFEFPFMTEIAPAFMVEVKGLTSPLEILDVGANFTSQPVEYRGNFECSDTHLNAIWKAARWAVQVCLQTHHLDSPNHQEPISDPGDYVIEAMVNHYAFAQPWLARQDLRKFAWLLEDEHYGNFHTSYSIAWLQMLMDYYDYTGDASLVRELAPNVSALLDTYASWRGTNGLISEAPNYMFMDWVDIGGFNCHHPPAVIGQGYLTALYYHGLELAARVAAMDGDTAQAEKVSRLRPEIAAAFNRELWVADKGLYRDGKPFQSLVKPGQWLPADKDIETFSPHVNLLAVLYGLAPREQQATIVERVLAARPLNTQPWFMHWVFSAIDHANLFEQYGARQMRRWRIVPETQSFREMWSGGDLSHGWCSTPLVQMSSRVLGVTPGAPGFKTVVIRPLVCDLTWARGSVPTPQGEVGVAWALSDQKLVLTVSIPANTEAEVTVPTSRFEEPAITLDGQKAERAVHLASGIYRFEVTGKLKPLPPVTSEEKGNDVGEEDHEADVLKDDLLHRFLLTADDHCTHTGGGTNPSALFNGTTRNGSGGASTEDDGQTFRGYGKGDWLLLRLKQPCDLSEVRTFSAHPDARASQAYTVLAAYAGDPSRFVKLTSASQASTGEARQLRVPVKAAGVVAVRFEFDDGPLGFNVYREINLLGRATPAVEPIAAFSPGARVLFQGDSITDGNRGRSLDPNHILGHGYVFIIAARHGAAFPEARLDFLNRGVSGNTVLDLEQRWQADTLDLKPDLLSILIGVNDHGKGISLDQFEQVYDRILAAAKAANPKLRLVLGEPFVKPAGTLDEDIRRRQEIVARLAQKHGAALVHFQSVFDEAAKMAPADYWIWDNVHPTYRGHQLMADEWERVVRGFWK
jgi:lysophospholipase L1-like esterase